MDNTISITIHPVPKPRQTRADKWKQRPCVVKYRAFADELRRQVEEKWGIDQFRQDAEAKGLSCTFWFEPPKSWSKKRREAALLCPHQESGDIDNLLKSVMDALFEEDKRIWAVLGVKKWAMVEGISISTIFENTP